MKRLKSQYLEMFVEVYKLCRKNVVLMQKILRTGFSRSINAACSGVLVQGSFIPRFCCNIYLGCSSYFIAFKVYNREDIRQVSFLYNITDSRTELKSLTCINRRFFVGSVFMH